jgi:hypothetical protein
MAINAGRVLVAAVEAAVEEIASPAPNAKHRRRLPAAPAFLLGAGTVTAARLAIGPHARQLLESVQERLAEFVEDDER